MSKTLALGIATLLTVVAITLGTAHAEAAVPSRDPQVWRVHNDTREGWTFAVNVDKQVGEKVRRVYVMGRPATRKRALWFLHTDLDINRKGWIHVRIVTSRENWHGWVRSFRADLRAS